MTVKYIRPSHLIAKQGDTVMLSSALKLLIGLSDTIYAVASPHGSWASRTPTVRRRNQC
jgi:1,2-phenylacetyl-CoA epoxidase catalytic subunit